VIRINGNDAAGMNFDGVGAVESLMSKSAIGYDFLHKRYRFYIFGTGSTARSFQRVLIDRGVHPELVEFVSSKGETAGLLQGSKVSNLKTFEVQASMPSIVVNATPLGSKAFPDHSPFQMNFLQSLEDTLELVFDFNYGVADSGPALAAERVKVAYFDGFWMNLFQAAHSFDYATFSNLELNIDQILELMKEPL
jgi:shikimate 5-dehydrogenase